MSHSTFRLLCFSKQLSSSLNRSLHEFYQLRFLPNLLQSNTFGGEATTHPYKASDRVELCPSSTLFLQATLVQSPQILTAFSPATKISTLKTATTTAFLTPVVAEIDANETHKATHILIHENARSMRHYPTAQITELATIQVTKP